MTYDQAHTAYSAAITELDDIEEKGKTMPYTSVNGHMFSILSKEGKLGIRLPEEEREKFLADHDARLMKQYGATMKEYVEIPTDLMADKKLLVSLLKHSYSYTSSLPPK